MAHLIGDFSYLKEHSTLTSLRLKARPITGPDIGMMLHRCPRLRRLVMYGCEISVLYQVYRYAPNLEILGVNHLLPIPELQENVPNVRGLRSLLTHDALFDEIPASDIFPLLYRNMMTLENIHVAIALPSTSWNPLEELQSMYANFTLPKVTRLEIYWSFEGIQKFMLPAIKETNTVSHLHLACTDNPNLPGRREWSAFRAAYRDTTSGSANLVSLFNRHAALSERRHNGLETIVLKNCTGTTDTVLASLADIKTMRRIFFHYLPNVTAEGIGRFLSQIGQQLQVIWLSTIQTVTDDHITALGKCEHLTRLELQFLPNITNRGILGMLDGDCCMLGELIVRRCPKITEECMPHAERKVKSARFYCSY
ncbi:hypothetical protein BJV82DRAFT_671963 [Fennellomyces sp. T-0311]|nr:hypothetical protein BJV82DRAFT_671963 [Fennellomyces sp. T-0311]